MRVLITGGTGFIGRALVKHLLQQNYHITLASRYEKPPEGNACYIAIPDAGKLFSSELISRIDTVVNLAGHNISAGRWTKRVKEQILNSRLQLTNQIVESIKRNHRKNLKYPRVLVNASAVGFYGTHPSTVFDEESPNGQGFLARVCKEWEQEARGIEDMVRLVRLRLGVVLGPGGALEKMVKPYQYGLGGYIGDGQQWCSWIHREDVINVIALALVDEDFRGCYNLCSPQPITMAELDRRLAQALDKRSWTRLPTFMAKLLLGEMADEILINGQHVYPQKLQSMQYNFKYPDIKSALENALDSD